MNAVDVHGRETGPRPSRHKARRLALQATYQWLVAGPDVDDLLEQFAHSQKVRGADWVYARQLVRGVAGCQDELEERISRHLDRPPEQLDTVEHTVLLLGAFELIHRPDVPYRAAINEAVNLTKVFGATDSYKYVNGILDRLADELHRGQAGTP